MALIDIEWDVDIDVNSRSRDQNDVANTQIRCYVFVHKATLTTLNISPLQHNQS